MTDLDLAKIKEAAERATPYEGYSVDVDGNVISTIGWRGSNKRHLTPHPNSHGYMRVKVRVAGKMKAALVHKLVCVAFHGPKPTHHHEVCHIDGDKTNNSPTNLVWGTRKDNANDRKRHGHEKAAENGRASAHKLRGRYNPVCRRGHDKEGRRSCNECRRNARDGNA